MAKKTKKSRQKLDALSFLHQPHDRYIRFVLQIREIAIDVLKFALKKEVLEPIDLDTLQLSDDSFIDPHLRAQFSDICYSGLTKAGLPFRVVIIFEHKSNGLVTPAVEQLIRYISGVWQTDIKQGRPISLTIPLLLYHGQASIKKETPADLFPGAPADLLSYVPAFDYEIIDIANLPDEALETLEFLALRNIFLALKHSRDNEYIDKFWRKIIIFAPGIREEMVEKQVFQATLLYINRVSPAFNSKIKDMNNAFTELEQAEVKPYFLEVYEEGMEKGIEKGMEKGMEKGIEKGMEKGIKKGMEQGREEGISLLISTFMRKNPTWTDEQIASTFEVDILFVKRLREK